MYQRTERSASTRAFLFIPILIAAAFFAIVLPADPRSAPAQTGDGSFTYTLGSPWTLLTWFGPDGVSVEDALRGQGPAAGGDDVFDSIGVVYAWDASNQRFQGFFPDAIDLSGVNDLHTLENGGAYWVARSGGSGTWRIGDSGATIPELAPLDPNAAAIDPVTGDLVIANEIMVGIGESANINIIAASVDASIVAGMDSVGVYRLRLPSPDSVAAAIESLSQRADVDFALPHSLRAAPEQTYPNDNRYQDSWNEASPGGDNWALEYIHAPSAWQLKTGNNNVRVAIIDFGFDLNHEDLSIAGHDAIDRIDRGNPDHGTHVAGTACGIGNNGTGISGVAWSCSLRVYNVAPETSFLDQICNDLGRCQSVASEYDILYMMNRAVDDAASVINMSLGTQVNQDSLPYYTAFFARAVERAGRLGRDPLFVIAAGNDGKDARLSIPASMVSSHPDNVIVVAGSRHDGKLFDTSNCGSGSNHGSIVDVAAPGFQILSALPNDSYGVLCGTSMAAPHVTGVAALVKAAHPEMSAAEIKQCIADSTAGRQVPGHDFGIVDAEAAVLCGESSASTPPQHPTGFSVTALSSTGIEVEWNDDSDNEEYFRITEIDDKIQPINAAADTDSYTITGLTPSTQYCFTLEAVNAAGSSMVGGGAFHFLCATTHSATTTYTGSLTVDRGEGATYAPGDPITFCYDLAPEPPQGYYVEIWGHDDFDSTLIEAIDDDGTGWCFEQEIPQNQPEGEIDLIADFYIAGELVDNAFNYIFVSGGSGGGDYTFSAIWSSSESTHTTRQLGDSLIFCYHLSPEGTPFEVDFYRRLPGESSFTFRSTIADNGVGGGDCIDGGVIEAPTGTREYLLEAYVGNQFVGDVVLTVDVVSSGGPTGWYLCDGFDYTGECLPITGDVYDYLDYGFNDRASSVIVGGGSQCLYLFEHNGYNGGGGSNGRMFVIGPGQSVPNLDAPWEFNDITSSSYFAPCEFY